MVSTGTCPAEMRPDSLDQVVIRHANQNQPGAAPGEDTPGRLLGPAAQFLPTSSAAGIGSRPPGETGSIAGNAERESNDPMPDRSTRSRKQACMGALQYVR